MTALPTPRDSHAAGRPTAGHQTVFNMLERTFDIGSVDCELCGWNSEDITVRASRDDRTWSVSATLGCYGGWYVDSTEEDPIRRLRTELAGTSVTRRLKREVLALIGAAIAEWDAGEPTAVSDCR